MSIFRLKRPYETNWSWQAAAKAWVCGFFLLCSVCFLTATLLLSAAPLPRAALTPAALPSPPSPTFHPNLLPTPWDSSAGMQLHSWGVQVLLGTCSPCSSSPTEPGSPSFRLPSCTSQFDVPCTPNCTITACPARQTASLVQGEGTRQGVSYQRGFRLLLEAP